MRSQSLDGSATRTPATSRRPVAARQIARDLSTLGVRPGGPLLVHASLRSIGWVRGGAPAVVRALGSAVGPAGHVITPTGTEANSRTSRVHRARIATLAPEEVTAFYRSMPAFEPSRTPSGMGAVSEALRRTDGAARSAHPQSSFAAVGPEADLLMAGHPLESHLGPDSPLGKLHQLDAQVLLIGVGYGAFTGFHLAEYLYSPQPPKRQYSCVVSAADGAGCWREYEDVVLDDREFEDIGEAMEKKVTVNQGQVGYADSRLVSLAAAVDFAIGWMKERRG